MKSKFGWLVCPLLLLLPVHAYCQLEKLKIAVHSDCPEGVPGCWPYIREGLETVKGLVVDEDCDYLKWMVQGSVKDGQIPDIQAISTAVHKAGTPFSIRGIEMVLVGNVACDIDKWTLSVPQHERERKFTLSKTLHPIEWNPVEKVVRPPAISAKDAFTRMIASMPKADSVIVRITVLQSLQSPNNLEVVDFQFRPAVR